MKREYVIEIIKEKSSIYLTFHEFCPTMACNTCAKPFTLLRKEKGCPSCGFSYCSKCLDSKIYVKKLQAEAKVCAKCKQTNVQTQNGQKFVEPPDAYYKRIGAIKENSSTDGGGNTENLNEKDQEIHNRLKKLKEDKKMESSEEEISKRLKNIKGEVPSTSDAELVERLAKLRGVPVATLETKPVLFTADTRSEQQQVDDLLNQYQEQTAIATKYDDEFNGLVANIETRLHHLKGHEGPSQTINVIPEEVHSEDEEDTVKKIIEKLKTEALLDDEISPISNDELPFCEICNEDATMRCLGCQYLFCRRCFKDHKDDDDGCNRYEPYTPPNRTSV